MIQNKSAFNQMFIKMIDQFAHDFYLIQLDKTFKCSCYKEGTSQPDPACPKCLGTGWRIKIRKIKGASQDSGIPLTSKEKTNFSMTKNYYIEDKYPIARQDLFYDGEELFIVYEIKNLASFKGEKIYNKINAVPKKFDTIIFKKNFERLIGGKR